MRRYHRVSGACRSGRRIRHHLNPHLYNGAIAVASTLHAAAAVASTRLIEWDVRANPLRRGAAHLLRDDGTVVLPTGPGIGLDIDLDRLTEFKEDA